MMIFPLQSEPLPNTQVQRTLALRVAKDILDVAGDGTSVEIGPLSAHNYSFTFSVKATTASGPRQVFVKIPKLDLRLCVPRILPITPGDRRLAQEEEASLRLLGQKWNGDDLEVRWVNLCGMIPECNALVTDRICADHAFAVFRRFDLRRRLGFRQDARRLRRMMARLGAALGRFHQANAVASVFRLADMLPKLEFYCRELAGSTGSPWPERVLRKLKPMGNAELRGVEVPTLKGIDMRNILIDAKDRLYLLDPGKVKQTHRDADLARFLMTYRILYWGSKLLPLVGTPDHMAEAAFLEAYYANSEPPCPQLLNLYLLKEQLKHWHTAVDSVRLRPWSMGLKRLASDVYVNPFYTRQIAAQLQAITG